MQQFQVWLFGAIGCPRFRLLINGVYGRLGSCCKHQPHVAQLDLRPLGAQDLDSNPIFSLKNQVFRSFICGTLYRVEASAHHEAQLHTNALPRNTFVACLAIVAAHRVVASHSSDCWHPRQHF